MLYDLIASTEEKIFLSLLPISFSTSLFYMNWQEALVDLLGVAGRRHCLPMVVCCSSRDELDAVCYAVSNLPYIYLASLVLFSNSMLFKTLQKSLPHSLSLNFLNIKADLVWSLLCLCLCHPIKFNTSEILRKSKSIASKCFIIQIIKFNVTTVNWRNNNISDAII